MVQAYSHSSKIYDFFIKNGSSIGEGALARSNLMHVKTILCS